MNFFLKRFVLAFCLVFVVACQPSQGQGQSQSTTSAFVGTDITGADFPKPLQLTDHTGKLRTMSDFKGKVVLLFFGYTHCPDVCPTTMFELKKMMKILGAQAKNVQVLFVTVDPQRDTQEVMAKFVPSFDPSFIGLRGSLQETAETLGNFKIFFAKVPGKTADDYTIDHSGGIYVFDGKGKIRLYFNYGQTPEQMASDVEKLM